MSYDLFFRNPGPAPQLDTLRAWFARRPHYRLGETQAVYENEASGVYWVFELHQDGDGVPLSFNLNYYRPDIFALEAAPELAALVEAFGLKVDDPQTDGMGSDAEYTVEGFLRGWNRGNEFAHRAILSRHADHPVLSLPRATNRGVWAWNRAREAYMDLLGTVEMIAGFAPTVLLLTPEDEPQRVVTACIWAEAMACAMPEVDVVLAMPAPRTPPRAIPLAELVPFLERFAKRRRGHSFDLDGREHDCGLAHWLVDFEQAPADLACALSTLGEQHGFQRVAPDAVLDREHLG